MDSKQGDKSVGTTTSGLGLKLMESDDTNALTMGLIGCLPDNVQQAIKSFSIRMGKQHITFIFPFMDKLLKTFSQEQSIPEVGSRNSGKPQHLTSALLFDQGMQVVSGFHTMVTLAPCLNRSSMPIVTLTLYQKGSSHGIQTHFQEVVRVLLDRKTSLANWKLPLFVIDASCHLMENVIEICAKTILEIQSENLSQIYTDKNAKDLLNFIQDEMVRPYLLSYGNLLRLHMDQVIIKMFSTSPNDFLTYVQHLQSPSCTSAQYKRAEMFFKNSNAEPVLKEFWKFWTNKQIGMKVFPIAANQNGRFQDGFNQASCPPIWPTNSTSFCNVSSEFVSSGILVNVPIKEGLQSIIKCLKSQEESQKDVNESNKDGEFVKQCCCCVCVRNRPNKSVKFKTNSSSQPPGGVSIYSDGTSKNNKWHLGIRKAESAFRRPSSHNATVKHHPMTFGKMKINATRNSYSISRHDIGNNEIIVTNYHRLAQCVPESKPNLK